jgi:TorA maturation chaperone TorD
MRFLIAGDGQAPAAALDEQRKFFHAHIESWYRSLADAIQASQTANFYRPVGKFMRAFLELETESFDID